MSQSLITLASRTREFLRRCLYSSISVPAHLTMFVTIAHVCPVNFHSLATFSTKGMLPSTPSFRITKGITRFMKLFVELAHVFFLVPDEVRRRRRVEEDNIAMKRSGTDESSASTSFCVRLRELETNAWSALYFLVRPVAHSTLYAAIPRPCHGARFNPNSLTALSPDATIPSMPTFWMAAGTTTLIERTVDSIESSGTASSRSLASISCSSNTLARLVISLPPFAQALRSCKLYQLTNSNEF